MPETITPVLYDPPVTPLPVEATPQGDGVWAWASSTTVTTAAWALTAAIITGLTVWLLMRRPRKADLSKHLMYVPLLLVNAAAIYGQVAFFYESVAPSTWPIPGKLALGILIALAVESIAVYVGWHAHDALINKAGLTARRLRRWSYLIALIVAGINYAHFAGKGFTPTAASVAFGLLSLVSPMLWGLHSRRSQHVQLIREGAVDGSGATFSVERTREFPFRSWGARRWSIDNNVADPDAAWEGYKTHLAERRAARTGHRLRGAWLVLSGHATAAMSGHRTPLRADITVGQPADTVTGHPADMRAVTGPDTVTDTAADTPADTAPDTDVPARPDTESDTDKDTRTGIAPPAQRTPRAPRVRTFSRTPDRTPKWTKDQLKAFKLKDTRPDMTLGQIAREVGCSEKTVSRWMKAREAADNAEERPSATDILPTFDLPKQRVLEGVNGNTNSLTKEH